MVYDLFTIKTENEAEEKILCVCADLYLPFILAVSVGVKLNVVFIVPRAVDAPLRPKFSTSLYCSYFL